MNHFDLAHTMGNQSPFKKLQRNPLRFLGLVLGLSGSLLLARCKKPSRSSDEDYVSQIMNAPEIPTDQGRDFKDPNSPSPGNKVARGQGRGQASGDSEHNKIQDDEQELKASRQTTEITPEIMPPGQQVPPQEQASKNPEPPLPPLPTIQAPGIKNVTLLTKTSNLSLVDSLEISWNGVPGASHYLLLVTSGKEPLFKPQNGSTYDTGIQGSEKILYVGSGTKFVYGGTGKFSEGFSLFVWSVHEAKVYSTKPEQVTFKPCNTLDGGQWVALPGDAAFGTSGFCVQKYPAVNSGELPMSLPMKAPWTDIDWNQAKDACKRLGNGYHLVTNGEWMTIASHAASLGPNWSDGAVGQGTLSRGHSDGSPNLTCQAQGIDGQAFVEGNCDGLANGNFRQKRTKILAHNQVIWDIGGNLWQWIDFTNLDDKPNPTQRSELRDLLDSKKTAKTDAIPTNAIQSYWQDNWDSDQGLGMLLVGANGLGGNLARGGHRSDDRMAGPFAFNLTMGPQTKLPFVGFRCAYSHPYQVTISSKSQ